MRNKKIIPWIFQSSRVDGENILNFFTSQEGLAFIVNASLDPEIPSSWETEDIVSSTKTRWPMNRENMDILVVGATEKKGHPMFCKNLASHKWIRHHFLGSRTAQNIPSTLNPKSVPSLEKRKDWEEGDRLKSGWILTQLKLKRIQKGPSLFWLASFGFLTSVEIQVAYRKIKSHFFFLPLSLWLWNSDSISSK